MTSIGPQARSCHILPAAADHNGSHKQRRSWSSFRQGVNFTVPNRQSSLFILYVFARNSLFMKPLCFQSQACLSPQFPLFHHLFISISSLSSRCSVVSCDISPSQLSQRISPPSFLFAKPHHKNHLLFLAHFCHSTTYFINYMYICKPKVAIYFG